MPAIGWLVTPDAEPEERGVVGEDPAVGRGQVVAGTVGQGGDADDRGDEMLPPGRTVEDGGAEGEDATVGGDQQ